MEHILQSFSSDGEERVSPQSEVFAKILIDIYMSCLLDFAIVLKVAEIIQSSNKDKVVIVLYTGTAHMKAVADFFIHRGGFRRKCFVGKIDWDDSECRKLQLPSYLWDFSQLFVRQT
jgi:hypothetical protein